MSQPAAAPAADERGRQRQRPPRHRSVQFIRIENANGEAAAPTPQRAYGHGGSTTPVMAGVSSGPSPAGGGGGKGGWGARPLPYPAYGKGSGTPGHKGFTPRGGGGAGSLPGTPRSCAGTPRCRVVAAPPPPVAKPTAAQDHKYFKVIIGASFLLTINAGFINAISLHNIHGLPAAHVTGMVAKASNFAATGQDWLLTQYVVAYSCFLIGACISGMLINYETFYLGRNYGRALFMIAAVQSVALLTENVYDDSIVFVWLCCFSCGLQNGLTSKYSGNAVRTTHLTGATTDLGIAIGHILKGRKGEWWKVKLHGIAVIGFFIGGVAGHFAFERFEHSALLFNVSLTAFIAVAHTSYVSYHERISVISVLESKSDIRLHKKRVRPPERLDANGQPIVGSAANTPKGGFGRFPSPRVLLSPTALANGLLKRRHFPKNGEAEAEAAAAAAEEGRAMVAKDTGKQPLLHSGPPPPAPPSTSSVASTDVEEGEEEGKNACPDHLEAGRRPSPPPPLPPLQQQQQQEQRQRQRVLSRNHSLPMARPLHQQPSPRQQQSQLAPPRVLPHHHSLPVSHHAHPAAYAGMHGNDEFGGGHAGGGGSCASTPRSLQQLLEEEGLVPMPEDMAPLPDFEAGDEAARASMLPSPHESSEGGECPVCCGCECEDGGVWEEESVEGEYGQSPRCWDVEAWGEVEEQGGEEEGENDSLTDDDDVPYAVEQGEWGMQRTASCGRCGCPRQEIEAGPSSAPPPPPPPPPQQQPQPRVGVARAPSAAAATAAATATVQAAAAVLAGQQPPPSSLQRPPLPPRGSSHPRRVIGELGDAAGAGANREGQQGPDVMRGRPKKPALKRGTSL